MAKLPSPKFNLRRANSQNPTLISLVLRLNGDRLVYSTGHSLLPKDWDFKQQRPFQRRNRPDLFMIKRQLDDLTKLCEEILLAQNYTSVGVSGFRNILDQKLGKLPIENTLAANSSPKKPNFIEFLDLELLDMEQNQGFRKSTLKSYRMQAEYLKRFAKEIREFDYEDVDWNFRLELIDWLAKRETRLSTGNKTLSILRQFLERARKQKLHNNTHYLGSGWMVLQKKAVGQKVILTVNELQLLATLELNGFAEKVRDLFLIGAGTGQRFSDYSKYSPNNFYKTVNDVPILSLISQKTDTPVKVPLNVFPWLIPLLEKYNYRSPKMSMQKFNMVIKTVCEQAGLLEKVFIVDQYINRKVKVKKSYVPKFQEISSHTCRRSFATNLYRMGYNVSQIMPMTGHAAESQLREYIGIDNEMNAEQIAFSIAKKRKDQIIS